MTQSGHSLASGRDGHPQNSIVAFHSMKNFFRLWHGELTLQNAFWNWAVFGGLVINIVTTALFLFLITTDRPISALIVGYAIPIPYNVIVLVGVWRSAERFTGERHLADFMRIVTVIGMVLLSII